LGLTDVNVVSDVMAVSGSRHMLAVPDYDVQCNTLAPYKYEDGAFSNIWLYASACVESTSSNGLIVSKNASDGFCILKDRQGDRAVAMNRLCNCVPFGTRRVLRNRETVANAVEQHIRRGEQAHPDCSWMEERFVWKSKDMGEQCKKLAPPVLWGSHAAESSLGPHAHELGVSHLMCISLKPEAVCMSGIEVGKLRTAAKAFGEVAC